MKTYYLLRFASWLSKWVPTRVGYWLCQLLGGILFYVKPSLRRQAMSNLAHVLPSSSRHLRRNIARKVIRNNFKNYYDLVRMPHLDKEDLEKSVVEVRGVKHLEEAIERGKGVIVVTLHMGSFNLVPQLMATRGYKAATIAEDIKPEKLYNLVNELREQFGLEFIRAGSSEVRTIYKFIRNSGVLMLAADRDLAASGVPVQFFDAIAELPSGPVVLAYRLNVPFIPAYIARLKDNRSIAVVYPPLEIERTGNREADIETNMRNMAQVLEKMVLMAPDQWVALLQKIWDKEESSTPAGPGGQAVQAQPPTDGHSLERTNSTQPHEDILRPASNEERSPSSIK